MPAVTADSMKLLSPKHCMMLFSPSNSQRGLRATPEDGAARDAPDLFAITERQADQEESSKFSTRSVNLPLSKIVVGCLVTICLTNCAYSIIAPFLPLYFKQYDIGRD